MVRRTKQELISIIDNRHQILTPLEKQGCWNQKLLLSIPDPILTKKKK